MDCVATKIYVENASLPDARSANAMNPTRLFVMSPTIVVGRASRMTSVGTTVPATKAVARCAVRPPMLDALTLDASVHQNASIVQPALKMNNALSFTQTDHIASENRGFAAAATPPPIEAVSMSPPSVYRYPWVRSANPV